MWEWDGMVGRESECWVKVTFSPDVCWEQRGTWFVAARVGSLTSTVEGHTASPSEVMLLKSLLVDDLLGNDIAGAE